MTHSCSCEDFVPKSCKAYCCGPVPISKLVYNNNLDKRCRPVIDLIDMNDMVLPQTGQEQCVFLSSEYRCQIYEDRPKTCREFGKIDSPLMQCPFMDKYGRRRTPQERKRVEKEFETALKKVNFLEE